MLELHIERLARSKAINKLVVATSDRDDDTPIFYLCRKIGVACFRGSLSDVLDRYYRAAELYGAETIVRLTGDCPLSDPAVIDAGIEFFLKNDFDYVGNCIERTFPVGLDFEVFRFDCLEIAWREAVLPSEREHVTPFIRNHPERFTIGHYRNPVDLSHHRWTVDEPEDFEFAKAVYEALYRGNPRFTTGDILKLLKKKPQLTRLNYHIAHGEGYRKSLREDSEFLSTNGK